MTSLGQVCLDVDRYARQENCIVAESLAARLTQQDLALAVEALKRHAPSNDKVMWCARSGRVYLTATDLADAMYSGDKALLLSILARIRSCRLAVCDDGTRCHELYPWAALFVPQAAAPVPVPAPAPLQPPTRRRKYVIINSQHQRIAEEERMADEIAREMAQYM
jgi:hypothetical protein